MTVPVTTTDRPERPLLVRYGNFLFRYRDAVFPATLVALFLLTRPEWPRGRDDYDTALDLTGVGFALLGQALRVAVIGYAYIIRGGRMVAPLKPNTIRINDNISTFLDNVVGVTRDTKGTIVWAADQVVYAPEIAVSNVRIDAIAENMPGE